MALDTPRELRSRVMYSVFVRQYGPEGTFRAVEADLDRIRALGADIVWLMPIHPIGEARRKGALGSPYAVRDYRAVNPRLGTEADFRRLTEAIHARGMRCVIDVVYNHTSPDSVLAQSHPEWFYRRPDGSFGSKNGDWSDIIDLDYRNPGLWDYQIDTLCRWARLVDGFRCDVAPLVPLDFWLRARREVAAVRPGCLWLAESVEPDYLLENRARGIPCLSDGELYQAFDVCYDYDVHGDFLAALRGDAPLSAYAAGLCRQEAAYPENYVKLRFLENHDRPRIRSLVPDERALRCWTAFLYFQKGMTLLYNGQEAESARRPDLFARDPVEWDTGRDLSPLLRRLARLKRHPLLTDGAFRVRDAGNGVLLAEYARDGRRLVGVFSTRNETADVSSALPDGDYVNLIDGAPLSVRCGGLSGCGEGAVIDPGPQRI